MADLFLGIDAGSSKMKAAVFDAAGHQVCLSRQRTPLNRPQPGWVEADPESSLSALDAVISSAVEQSAAHGVIRAVGISAAMVGAWLVDDDGKALRPGINWEDSRSQDLLDMLIEAQPTFMSDIFAVSGSVLQQGCTLPLLAWFAHNDPGMLERAAHVLTYKDFLRHHLTGTFAGDVSEAAVMPGDARSQGHSDALMKFFDIEGYAAMLPTALPSHAVAGHVTEEASSRTGLPTGTPVVAGAGDVVANVIGSSGLKPGAVTAILGTTCMVGVCCDEPIFTPPDLGLLFSLPERHWYRAMVNVAGTLNLDWAIQLVAPDLVDDPDLFAKIAAMVGSVPVGANGVTYLPYLSESGIIAPVADDQARAQFCGLHAGHDRADILRAVYEGVAFAIADLVELLPITSDATITLMGGGSASVLWTQMIADVTGRSILVPKSSELGAKGAALLAATGQGCFRSVVAASQSARAGARTIDPDAAASAAWQDARARYIHHRQALLGAV